MGADVNTAYLGVDRSCSRFDDVSLGTLYIEVDEIYSLVWTQERQQTHRRHDLLRRLVVPCEPPSQTLT